MFMTEQDLKQLTHRSYAKAQQAVLDSWGVLYKVRPDGSLCVLRSHIEQVLGGEPVEKKRKPITPDFNALYE